MASLKKCIEAKCKDCTYDQEAPGTWREQVEACTVQKCPLWSVRPMTVATINLVRKGKSDDAAEIAALIDGLEDEDEDAPATVA
jgi:hypothetical protein